MGKRKRALDKKEAEQYIPEFSKANEIHNNEMHVLFREMDPDIHKDIQDSRVMNNVKRPLRFSKDDSYIPSSNQRRAARLAREFEDHLRDHVQYFQNLTHSESVTSSGDAFKSQLKESSNKRRKVTEGDSTEEGDAPESADTANNASLPQNVHHMCLRGLGKKVSEKEFRKMMGEIPFLNLKMHVGKRNITSFVVIGDNALKASKAVFHNKKIYGKKLQLWEKVSKSEYTGTTKYIYVGNLPPATKAGMIGGFLLGCGKIRSVTMVPGKSCCFIRFKHRDSVKKALQLNNAFYNGFYIRISEEKNVNDMVLDKFNEENSDVNLEQFDSDLDED